MIDRRERRRGASFRADDFNWFSCWHGVPDDEREVLVLVASKDGQFSPDIGSYYSESGQWSVHFWKNCRVVAWVDVPSYEPSTTANR